MPARRVTRFIHEGTRELVRNIPPTMQMLCKAAGVKNRDAVFTSQAHPEAGLIAAARSQWVKGRVVPCCDRLESAKGDQANCSARVDGARRRRWARLVLF